LQPHRNGTIELQNPGSKPEPWKRDDLDRKIQELNTLTVSLKAMMKEFTEFRYEIPSPDSWLNNLSFRSAQPLPLKYPIADLDNPEGNKTGGE
jgi:hypothetical protein